MQGAGTAARRQYHATMRRFEDVLYGRTDLGDLDRLVYANPGAVQWWVYTYTKNRGTSRERGLGKFLSERYGLVVREKPPRPDGAVVADRRANAVVVSGSEWK